jgi:predicted transposase YbfD/YdcC
MVHFPHVAQAAVVIRTTHHLKSVRITEEIEIALSSRSAVKLDAAGFQTARRGHWGIENPIHYVRDVTFGEDRSTICKKDAPRNMAALRNLVIGICGLDAARKGKSASYLPRFRSAVKNDKQIAVELLARPLLNDS